MRKNVFLLALFFAMVVVSCNMDARHRQLIGGIKDAIDRELSKSDGTLEEDKDTIPYVEPIDGLELPATLSGVPEQILRRTGYTVSYNSSTLIPNWVAWHLTAEHTEGAAKRPRKAFHEDTEVLEPRAVDWDYYNSGYDRGHMCPAADNKWSATAMSESFLFTNICPQNRNLNAGDWSELETSCRRWAKEYGDIYIVCGPILYKGKHKTIGDNKVTVPEAFFKVVLCIQGPPKAIGFIYKNERGDRPQGDYVNSVDEVERITGFDFFPLLPDDVEERIEATCNLDDWYSKEDAKKANVSKEAEGSVEDDI
ncbi:MAG: DNA/RNA non-specific endonuclease [Prevotella sp.]|nr:DNA/RNA non-specific endonuclease [Prevotella sp.]